MASVITSWKRQNQRASQKDQWLFRERAEKGMKKHKIFREVALLWKAAKCEHVTKHLFKPTDHTTPRLNPHAKYRV